MLVQHNREEHAERPHQRFLKPGPGKLLASAHENLRLSYSAPLALKLAKPPILDMIN